MPINLIAMTLYNKKRQQIFLESKEEVSRSLIVYDQDNLYANYYQNSH